MRAANQALDAYMQKLLISVLLLLSLSVLGQEPTNVKVEAFPASETASIASVRTELEATLETDQSYRHASSGVQARAIRCRGSAITLGTDPS